MLKKILKCLPWIGVIAVMILIFYFSSQVADRSNELSTSITERIAIKVQQLFSLESISIKSLNHIVRKSAHFIVFAALGFFLALSMLTISVRLKWAWLIGTLYAGTDELHQMFVPGRGPMLRDVALDSAGVLFGVLFVFIIYKICKRNS